MTTNRENWGSKVGFILAAAGSAVGLGNIWRFPYVTGENGGGVFIFVYIICVLLLGLPLLLAELTIGRHTQLNPLGAFKKLKPRTPWFTLGGLGILTGFIIFSFYAVVAGWTLGYLFTSIKGTLSGISAEKISLYFDRFVENPLISMLCFAGVVIITTIIVARGIKGGIEKWSKILMPALFIMLVLVMIRSLTLPGASAGLKFLFWPDFSELEPSIMLKALGQAFFSMSLGMGCMLTYGSYLSKKENMPFSGLMIGGLDLGVALLGGLAVFPALFAFNMNPEEGTGLVFKTLPVIFNQIPLGSIIMPIFFLLLLVAALTSTLSLMEVITAYFIDEKGWSRKKATYLMGLATIIIGTPSALSSGILSEKNIGFSPMAIMEKLATEYGLPIGAFFISIFVGFVWNKKESLKELTMGAENFRLGEIWIFILRFIAPFIMGQVILFGFLNEFESLQNLVQNLTNIFSIIDAGLIVLLVIGAIIYLMLKRKKK